MVRLSICSLASPSPSPFRLPSLSNGFKRTQMPDAVSQAAEQEAKEAAGRAAQEEADARAAAAMAAEQDAEFAAAEAAQAAHARAQEAATAEHGQEYMLMILANDLVPSARKFKCRAR